MSSMPSCTSAAYLLFQGKLIRLTMGANTVSLSHQQQGSFIKRLRSAAVRLNKGQECRPTIRACRRRGQRTMFPDTFLAGAAHLNRYGASLPTEC